jgi:hypothetical protein
MNFALALTVALTGFNPGPAAPIDLGSGSVAGGEDTISREQAAKIQKAARNLKRTANDVEEIAHKRGYSRTLFWADRLGDLADTLVDEAGDLIRGGDGRDDEVRHLLRELYGAYSNYRTYVGNIPEERDRKMLLKGTLKAYRGVFEATCGPTPSDDDKALAPPRPGPDDSD